MAQLSTNAGARAKEGLMSAHPGDAMSPPAPPLHVGPQGLRAVHHTGSPVWDFWVLVSTPHPSTDQNDGRTHPC